MKAPNVLHRHAATEIAKRADEVYWWLLEHEHAVHYRAWKLDDAPIPVAIGVAAREQALVIAMLEHTQRDMEVVARAMRDLSKETSALLAALKAKVLGGDGG